MRLLSSSTPWTDAFLVGEIFAAHQAAGSATLSRPPSHREALLLEMCCSRMNPSCIQDKMAGLHSPAGPSLAI